MPPQKKPSRITPVIMVLLLAVAIGTAVAAVVGKHGLLTYIEMNRRHEIMQKELVELKEENNRLRDEIEALKNDPETLEKVAREELGMIKLSLIHI